MMDLIRREKKKYAVVKRDRLSIKEKLIRLKTLLKEGETTQFDRLLDENETGIIDKVITFISLLELARLKKLQIFQNEDKGSIYIEVKESLDSFDPETANGFEPEGGEVPTTKEAAPATAEAPIQ
jgi:segregation and condensation protein A